MIHYLLILFFSLGMNHWNNKLLVEAMAIESFKMFKSPIYNLIKVEYWLWLFAFKWLVSQWFCLLTKMRNKLNPVESSWNHPETAWKQPYSGFPLSSFLLIFSFTPQKSTYFIVAVDFSSNLPKNILCQVFYF